MILPEYLPGSGDVFKRDVLYPGHALLPERLLGSNGNTVVFTHLEECEQFIKDVIRGHQGLSVPPHPCCGGPMIWVTADKVRKSGTGVDKHSHQSVP